jgi:diguanylate cyclase (GGDEF)-like protein
MITPLPSIPGNHDVLYRSTLFKGVPPPLIDRCLQQSEQHHLAAGEILLSPTGQNQHIFLVLAGCFSVHLNSLEDAPLAHLETGECIGEVSILDHQNPSGFVVAREASTVLAISRDILWTLLEESPQIARNLLSILAQRSRDHQAAILVREQHAYVDTLTGLRNRRWLETMFVRAQKRTQIDGRPLCLIMLDVDHFKGFNDRYGHLAGDKVLCMVAECLNRYMRPQDIVARFGGEEFVVVLPAVDLPEAMTIAERLRIGVDGTAVATAGVGKLPPVTVSLGIARMLPGETLEALVARADAALYRAKAEGRNRVAVAV